MSEWFKEPVLKTGDSSRAVGSNPTLSANFIQMNHTSCRRHGEVPKLAEGAPLLRE